MAENKIKTYEIFGFDRVENSAVINIIENIQDCGYVGIGIPGDGDIVRYCAGISIGKFCIKKTGEGEKAILFMTLEEIMDLYQAIPQIIAEEAGKKMLPEMEGKKQNGLR